MGKMKDLHYELWNCYGTMQDTIKLVGIRLFLHEMPMELRDRMNEELSRQLDVARMSIKLRRGYSEEK